MVLCISHQEDYYNIELVMEALSSLGLTAVRWNSDTMNWQQAVSLSIDPATGKQFHLRDASGHPIDPRKIKAVWNRKLWDIPLPPDLDSAYSGIYLQEYHTLRNIILQELIHLPWFNPLATERLVAHNKFLQLDLANRHGLKVPRTLMTNAPEEAGAFIKQTGIHNVIVKMHGTLSQSMSGNTAAFPTSRLSEESLEHLSGLRYTPMIFQEFIEKAYELRIMYVAGTFFSGKLQSNASVTDWRYDTETDLKWEPYTLPGEIQRKLHQMMTDTGLYLGAIDMIKSTNDEYVFLEVNPSGEWGMLQKELSYPIAETIAQKISEKIKTASYES